QKMRSALIKVLWVILLGAVVYGGYAAYGRWWNGSGTTGEQLKEKALQVTGGVQKAVEKNVSAAKEKAGKTAGTYLSEAAGAAEQYVKDKTSEALSSLGGAISSLAGTLQGGGVSPGGAVQTSPATVPAAQGGQFTVPPPPAAISIRADVPFVLAINRKSSYEVEWGDGATEKGSAPLNQTTLISHRWSRAGDYTVGITVSETNSTYRYAFPVRVYD
ncbi:hypothetical protein COX26_00370, partial [Candidatus Jorgensenbacteria bacterium CG23_combo_of_CG06-09_8_20_14_all_54_14]